MSGGPPARGRRGKARHALPPDHAGIGLLRVGFLTIGTVAVLGRGLATFRLTSRYATHAE